MQFTESSIIGLRSAVTTLTHPATPLKFILFPMVHVAEQQFYDEVAARARLCQLIVAEGVPLEFVPAQEWMARHRRGPFVDQGAALRLQELGVRVYWEAVPGNRPGDGPGVRDGYRSGNRPKSPREKPISRVADVVGAATLGLARRFVDPRTLPGIDQAEEYDESVENLTGGWFARNFEYNARTVRDARLIRLLDEIHRDRATEQATAGVVFGAAHMPAAASHLCGKLGYIASSSEWLTVAHAKSLASRHLFSGADNGAAPGDRDGCADRRAEGSLPLGVDLPRSQQATGPRPTRARSGDKKPGDTMPACRQCAFWTPWRPTASSSGVAERATPPSTAGCGLSGTRGCRRTGG
jgi:hypothetical protein